MMSDSCQAPPHFSEGERAVMGACLLDSSCIPGVTEQLCADDFYHEKHRIVFQAIIDIYNSGVSLDWVSLTDALKKQGRLLAIGGPVFLTDLVDAVPSAANALHYVGIIKEYSVRRQLSVAAQEALAQSYDLSADISDIQINLQRSISDISSRSQKQKGLVHVKSVITESLLAIENADQPGIETGFCNLDAIFDGFFPGDFVLLAGRPSMGKSAVALDMLFRISQHIPCGFFSVEMANIQNGMRLLSKKARVNLRRLRKGIADTEEMKRVVDSMGPLSELNLYIDESSLLTVSHIRNRTKHLEIKTGVKLGLIVIDYLQIMTAEGKYQSREREIGSISQGLKILAKDLGIPILCLSQLSRKCEERPFKNHGKRPINSDLRDSGTLEQDADAIIFVYRPEVYVDKNDKDFGKYSGQAQLPVSKQRNGPLGIADMYWEAETATFRDATPEYRGDEEPRTTYHDHMDSC